jgi:hypothetical protein
VIYSYALDMSKERLEAVGRLDEHLASLNAPARETWGLLPSHQRGMQRAADLAGGGGR